MSLFNKKIIQSNFTKKSNYYEKHAKVQKFALENLFEQLFSVLSIDDLKNKKILDLGSGTGLIGSKLNQLKLIDNHQNNVLYEIDLSLAMLKNSKNFSQKINADIENLPLKDKQFDLILSSFALHWLNDLNNSVNKISQKLKTSGLFALAIPNHNSLTNLRKNNPFFLNNFIDYQFILSSLQRNQLQPVKSYHNQFDQDFLSQIDALKHIKKIGANYSQLHDDNFQQKSFIDNFKNRRIFYKKNLHNSTQKFTLNWQIDYLILKKID